VAYSPPFGSLADGLSEIMIFAFAQVAPLGGGRGEQTLMPTRVYDNSN